MTAAAVVAPVRRNLDELVPRLSSWLANRLPGASNLRVSGLNYPLGAGLSNETILFDANWEEAGRSRSKGLVLRLRPESYRVYMEVNFEAQFQLQKTLHDEGLAPVPETIWYEPDAGLFGQPFYVMGRLTGRVPVSFPPYISHGWVAEATTAERERLWRNAVAALARLHLVPEDSVALLAKPQHGGTGWEQEWNYWMKSHAWACGERVLPTCERTLDWLRANMPDERLSGLCWGDSRIGNLMFDDDMNVIAIMDWEGASLGGSLQDLGFWLALDDVMATGSGAWPAGFGSREDTIALWESISGGSARDIFWYEVFAGFKLASHVARKLTLDGNSRPGFNYNDNGATRYLAKKLDLPAPSPLI